jgi:hypothetical protein
MVVYMSENLAESGLLIASTVLSNDSHLVRQFAAIAPGPFDFPGSIVGPQGLNRMVFYMSVRLSKSAVLIGSTVLSNASYLDRQFAAIAPGPFDFPGSVVGPQGLERKVFYMSEDSSESAVLIGSMVLSNDSTSHRNSHPHPPHPWILEKAS